MTERKPSGHMKLYGYQPATPLTASGCVHHWLVESPHAGPVMGVCRKCGAVREFQIPDYLDMTVSERAKAGGRAKAHAMHTRAMGAMAPRESKEGKE